MIEYAHAIEGVIALAALGVFVFGPLQWVTTDAARQHLFSLRDRLFDIAHSGRMDFSSVEYRLLRATFDRQIQYAHLLSFWRLLMLARVARRVTKTPRAIEGAVASIGDDETRNEVKGLVQKMNQTAILMICAKSPVLWVLVLIAFVAVMGLVAGRKLVRHGVYSPAVLAQDAFQKLLGRSVAQFAPLIQEEVAGMTC